ncbi:hypothetical protein [Planktotalea sp.]|uniref:hypothetical protein n=1 Tax=Planktotalea sp. TaxID=2029877 RepID=UPI003D6B4ACD
MQALRISNATRVLADSQDEYHALTIHDEVIDGVNHMTSLWEPTPKELADLANGGSVKLTILGTGHPPVSVTTQKAPE